MNFGAQARWFGMPGIRTKKSPKSLLNKQRFGEMGESTAPVHKIAIGEAIGKVGNKRTSTQVRSLNFDPKPTTDTWI